jgi:hypothetical protein
MKLSSIVVLIGALQISGAYADTANPNAAFEKLFPFYTTTCVTGKTTRNTGEASANFGHEIMYIKGACKDNSVGYPKLKMCDATDSEGGVVLSLDGRFSNTLFTAVPGKEFLINAGVKSDEPFTQATLDAVMQRVVDTGALKGVKVGRVLFDNKPEKYSEEQWMANTMTPTDWGISLGRESYCLNIPMNQAQIQAEVDHLDTVNEPFVTEKAEVNWTLLGTNCATLVHNTLHAIGIRGEINEDPTKLVLVGEAFKQELPIPTNDFSLNEDVFNRVNKIDIAEVVFANKELRDLFDRFDTLPEASPTLLEYYPAHTYQNEIFTAGSIRWFELLGTHFNRNKIEKILANPAYGTIQGSLERVLKRLQYVQSTQKPVKADADSDLGKFAFRYNAWVQRSIDDLTGKLASLK